MPATAWRSAATIIWSRSMPSSQAMSTSLTRRSRSTLPSVPTKALLQHIEEPGIDVEFLFREVRDSVREATNNAQDPVTYSSLPGKAVFLSPPKEAPLPPAGADAGNEIAAEVAFWNTIKDS